MSKWLKEEINTLKQIVENGRLAKETNKEILASIMRNEFLPAHTDRAISLKMSQVCPKHRRKTKRTKISKAKGTKYDKISKLLTKRDSLLKEIEDLNNMLNQVEIQIDNIVIL